MTKNKILITGGSGLVGNHLKDILPGAVYISSKDFDLTKMEEVHSMMDTYKPETVIHLAARVGGVGGNMSAKGEFYYDNIMMNTNVLEASRLVGVKKLVSFLSTCIFPDNVEYPLTEKKIHLGAPHSSNYGYAYAKRMLDVQTEVYREQYGVNFISVIPTNIYGPHDNFNIETGHVLPSLIHKCYLAKKNNTDLEVWGDGSALREFIYSEDVAVLTEWALNNYEESEPIIFTTSDEISIKGLVDIIVTEMGFEGKVYFNTSKPNGQHRKPSDNSKLLSYLPDFKFTPIEDGIRKTIQWVNDNYKNMRK